MDFLEFQKKVVDLYNLYKSTDRLIIKANLIDIIDNADLKHNEIAKKTGLSARTIYHIKKVQIDYIPDFFTTLLICNLLNVDITDLFRPNYKKTRSWNNTIWDLEAKEEFYVDYNNLTITEICNKYKITPRTAQEYFKNFKIDLGFSQ